MGDCTLIYTVGDCTLIYCSLIYNILSPLVGQHILPSDHLYTTGSDVRVVIGACSKLAVLKLVKKLTVLAKYASSHIRPGQTFVDETTFGTKVPTFEKSLKPSYPKVASLKQTLKTFI